jgi:hypothetical protein
MTSFKTRLARKMGVNEHLGEWNAQTNTPQLTSGVGQVNGYYIVSVSGSTELDGESDWKVDDWVYFTGTVWKKIDNTDDLSGSSGNGDGATPVTYVSSINNFTPGGAVNNTYFELELAAPLPLDGRLYCISEEIFTSQLTQNLLDSLPSGYVSNQNNTVFFSGMVSGAGNAGVKFYIVYAPGLDIGGGVKIPFVDVLFPIAEITSSSSGLPDGSLFHQNNYLEVEINTASVMDELRYLHSKQLISTVQNELLGEVSTLNTEINSIQSQLNDKLSVTGGTLSGPVTTNSHINLNYSNPSNGLAAVSKSIVETMLTPYLKTWFQSHVDANYKNIYNLQGLETYEINFKPNSYIKLNGDHTIYDDVNDRTLIKLINTYVFGQTDLNSWSEVVKISPVSGNTDHLVKFDASLRIKEQSNGSSLIAFYNTAGTQHGQIEISGSTVFYSNFCGSHTSQLQEEFNEIKVGTVMESLDDMCGWVGEPIEDRLPKAKVCVTEESSSVYGVYSGKKEDSDILVASVGVFYCRIAPNISVKKGDLLVSNGDGCARVQSDDIIRSKTIGKVLSTTIAHTYEDGSYTVPVALYCG